MDERVVGLGLEGNLVYFFVSIAISCKIHDDDDDDDDDALAM